MHAHAVRLQQRAHGLVVVHVALAQLVLAQHARVVAEDLAHDAALVLQEGHLLLPMRRVQMAARLRVAVHLRHQALPVFETLADLGVQPAGRVQPPALDPLRAVQPSRGVLALAAVAAGAAPDRAVGFQHHGAHAVIARQRQRRRQPGEARADHGHVHLHVAIDRAVVLRRRPGGGNPVGGRVVLALPRRRHQRIVGRVIRPGAGAARRRSVRAGIHPRIHASVHAWAPCGIGAAAAQARAGKAGRCLR